MTKKLSTGTLGKIRTFVNRRFARCSTTELLAYCLVETTEIGPRNYQKSMLGKNRTFGPTRLGRCSPSELLTYCVAPRRGFEPLISTVTG